MRRKKVVKYWLTEEGCSAIEQKLTQLEQRYKSVRNLETYPKLITALRTYEETYHHSDWNHMQEPNRGVALNKIFAVLDALGLEHNSAYYKPVVRIEQAALPEIDTQPRQDAAEEKGTQVDRFAVEYRNMPQWQEFPVREFSGDTTLENAVQSQVSAVLQIPHDADLVGLDMMTANLHDVRSNRKVAQDAQTVLETLARLHRENRPPHVLIFGEAGDGKSTLLRKLGKQYCQDGLYPVLIPARDWEDSKKPLRDYLADIYFAQEESDTLRSGGALLWEKILSGQAPLLIDGLDETQNPQEIGTRLTRVVQAMQARGEAEPIILVTSRRQGYRNSLRGFVEVEMRPFDYAAQVVPYIHTRLHEDAAEFLARLESDRRTQALIGNGLMLAMLCTLWESRRQSGNVAFDLPISRGEVYDRAVNRLLDHPEKVGRKLHTLRIYDAKLDLKRAILAAIAFHAQFCHQRTQQIPYQLVKKALQEVTDNGTRFEDDWPLREAVLEDIVLNSELLSCDASGQSYRFFHPTFQEYFAAQYLVDHWDAELWRDWLPVREDWPLRGYPDALDVFENNLTAEEERDFLAEFRCPVCHNLFPPLPDLLARPIYRETFLLMVGMLNDANREAAFLNGLTDRMPLIRSYEYKMKTDRGSSVFGAALNTNNFNEIGMTQAFVFACYRDGKAEDASAVPYLEMQAFLADFHNWQSLALQAISRCSEAHQTAVTRALSAFMATAVRQMHHESLHLLGRSRCGDNTSVAVTALINVISNRAYFKSNGFEETIASMEWIKPGFRDSVVDLPMGVADLTRLSLGGMLAEIGGEEAEEYLLTVLQDENENVWFLRSLASQILQYGSTAIKPRLLPIFALLLADVTATAEQRTEAAKALTKIGGAQAVLALIGELRDRRNPESLRQDMAVKLLQLPEIDQTGAIGTLITTYRDTDDTPLIRRTAAFVFGNMLSAYPGAFPDEVVDGIEALETILANDEEEDMLRLCIAGILGTMHLRRSIHPTSSLVLQKVLTDPTSSHVLRREAALSLGFIGVEVALHSLEAVGAEETGDHRLRVIAQLAAERIRSGEGTQPVASLLAEAKDPVAMPVATRNLMDRLGFEFITNLVEVIVDKTAEARRRVLVTGQLEIAFETYSDLIEELNVVPILLRELRDSANALELRQAIIRELPALDAPETLQTLLDVFNATNPAELRQTVAWALGKAGSLTAIEPLIRELWNSANPPSLRCTIIRALTKLDAGNVREHLEQIACDTEEAREVREESVKELLDIRDKEREKRG